jgi:ComF family protein
MSIGDSIKDLKQGFTHLFYPRLCEGCNKPLLPEEEVLCLNCNVYSLPRTAYHHIPDNETAMRFAGRFPFERATTLAYFTNEGLLQHLLHELKYNSKKQVGIFLGHQLGYDLKQTTWTKGIDMIVPVPLHKKKQAERGYNQSELIAEGLGAVLKIPVEAELLERVRHTESQTKKTRAERIENMSGAFRLKNTEIAEKHILLVDDVLTTGATLEACALAIHAAAVVKLSMATIGIAS